jgi:hypothetical protein
MIKKKYSLQSEYKCAMCENHKCDPSGFPEWREISQEEYEWYLVSEVMDE